MSTFSFDKFSLETQKILVKSQEFAEIKNNGVIASEHLLLALLQCSNRSPAKEILREYMVDEDQINLIIELEPKITVSRKSRDGITDEARFVIERSALQAIHTRATLIEPIHLLWAMITDQTCTAHLIIIKTGVYPDHLRGQLEHYFHEHIHLDQMIEQHLELLEMNYDDIDSNISLIAPPKKKSLLESMTEDLTKRAKQGELDPMIGREIELQRLIHILLKRTKSNPILIGEPGVGKTAIVEGLAQRIVTGEVPSKLCCLKLKRLDVSSLVAGTMFRGQFEDRIKRIIAEIEERQDIILFIDEIHTVIGAGSAEGSLDAANIFKPALARGKIQVIGATTFDEYQKHIEKDAAFERRFQSLIVREPTIEETLAILQGIRPRLESYHQLRIPDETIKLSIKLAYDYIPSKKLPDKAIDIVDEAAAAINFAVKKDSLPISPNQITERKLKAIVKEKEYELKQHNFERAAFLRDQELKLKLELTRLSITKFDHNSISLTENAVIKTVSRMSGIPEEQLDHSSLNSSQILNQLSEQILGQSDALLKISRAVMRARAGFKPNHQPRSALLFAGPTGVGKTETAYALARIIYGSSENIIRLDMSEFKESHTTSRLIGSPPGYVGHEEAGRLTEQVRQKPASIILFDEVEKAHPDIFNLLLQILDYGILTDSKGRKISFRNSHIILTTNAGSDVWTKESLGFSAKISRTDRAKEMIQNMFKVELINRLDEVIVFNSLDKESINRLIDLKLTEINKKLIQYSIRAHVHENARSILVRKTITSSLGARELFRLIANELESKIIEIILSSSHKPRNLRLNYDHDHFNLQSARSRSVASA